jgi:hypothetical protein
VIEKCFMGRFQVSAWEEALVNVGIDNSGTVRLRVEGKKKYSNAVTAFYQEMEKNLRNHSIYRAKTVVVTKGSYGVDFEIMENKGEENIILNGDETRVIDTFITPALTERGKSTFLFIGDYGTGKTESAMGIGREATAKGLTFFYCKHADIFQAFLNISKKYQPCVVFLEDERYKKIFCTSLKRSISLWYEAKSEYNYQRAA